MTAFFTKVFAPDGENKWPDREETSILHSRGSSTNDCGLQDRVKLLQRPRALSV